ncbi:hypothetical protein VM1G_02694 [Cytospora mali]|uniref:Uncharacterized protein n=1 Tax=Cytospora mali TaxID=578113 RepID=A0A194VST0_CYTMA|nr:hypothetical protein VM1G_02694 [Valsa mali]
MELTPELEKVNFPGGDFVDHIIGKATLTGTALRILNPPGSIVVPMPRLRPAQEQDGVSHVTPPVDHLPPLPRRRSSKESFGLLKVQATDVVGGCNVSILSAAVDAPLRHDPGQYASLAGRDDLGLGPTVQLHGS